MNHSIQFVADGLMLSGVLHLPDGEPSAVVIGCHGLMSDKNSPKQVELARRCTAMGMAYLRFDHRGCGESEGVFEKDTTLGNRLSDLMTAVHTLEDILGKTVPVGLFGSSLGGTLCLTAASGVSPFAVVTLAAPVQSRSIRIPEDSPESLKNEILKDRLSFDMEAHIASIHHILIIHGSGDETVSVENADRIFNLARNPKKRLILKDGDHRISRASHQKLFIETAVRWFADCHKDWLKTSS